jgi:hypothetical protein
MPEDMPSPPEVAELDQEVQELEDEHAELRVRWRWAVAGAIAAPLVVAGLIFVAILIEDDSLIGFFVYGGLGGIMGGVVCIGYAIENRNQRHGIDREIRRLKSQRRDVLAGRAKRSAAPYARYKEHLPFLAEHYKIRARRYRRIYVALQLVVIIGSLSVSAVTALTNSVDARVVPVAMSLLVAIAASCSLTFKVRERGETLQQTGMDIEREYRAAELRIGDYAEDSDDSKVFRKLVERVESMRAEQARKERTLDQPPDLQQSTSSGIGTV